MWVIVPALNVAYYIFWLVNPLRKAHCYCLPYELKATLALKSALLLVIVLSARKQYTDNYWLFYSQYCKGEWLILFLLQISRHRTMKVALSTNICWTMMIIVHMICICPICPLSFLLTMFKSAISCHFYHNIFESVKYLHKIPFPISIYTTTEKNKIKIMNFVSRTNLRFLYVDQ